MKAFAVSYDIPFLQTFSFLSSRLQRNPYKLFVRLKYHPVNPFKMSYNQRARIPPRRMAKEKFQVPQIGSEPVHAHYALSTNQPIQVSPVSIVRESGLKRT